MNTTGTASETTPEELFALWSEKFEPVEGYLHPMEGFTLAMFAKDGPGDGAIVEIGSFMGRSTCWLAAGSLEGGREVVHAVDHFQGSPEHQVGGTHPNAAIAEKGTTFHRFIEHVRGAGVEHHVSPITMSSLDAAAQWEGPIRLLFIDGDHSYEASKADFDAWLPYLNECGCIAFHDVGAWAGVTQFVNELLSPGTGWKLLTSVNSLRVVTRAG